jgi:hypothetical protein
MFTNLPELPHFAISNKYNAQQHSTQELNKMAAYATMQTQEMENKLSGNRTTMYRGDISEIHITRISSIIPDKYIFLEVYSITQ